MPSLAEHFYYDAGEEITSYNGPISSAIISEMAQYLRWRYAQEDRVNRKVFAIFIELAQNMSFYSNDQAVMENGNTCGLGKIVLYQTPGTFVFKCSNKISKEQEAALSGGLEIINSLDKDGLRHFKREQRDKPRKEGSKGAGIGLIQIAILSENPLETSFIHVNDEQSFFLLGISVDYEEAPHPRESKAHGIKETAR